MRAEIKTDRMQFLVGKPPEPKTDGNGGQKTDRASKEPLYVTELVVVDDDGAEVIKVTTAGQPARLVRNQPVQVLGLVAQPWEFGGRAGVAYRADSITPAKQPTAQA